MTTTPPIKTTRDGFPIVTCTRCNGTGMYPSSAWNGICLQCNGQRVAFPTPAVAKLAAQWHSELHTLSRVTPAVRYVLEADSYTRHEAPVAVGDQLRHGNAEEWRTVASVQATTRVVGSCSIGTVDSAVYQYTSLTLLTVITFTDGTTEKVYGEEWHRAYDVDAARARREELAAQAVASYTKYPAGAPARDAAAERRREKRAAERREADAAKAAEKAAEEAAEAAAWAATVEANPELADLATARYADAKEFMGDMRDRFAAGTMTDKQVAAAVERIRRDRQRAADHAQLVASGVTAPTGRVVITGTVTATWTKETDFGVQFKMRITSDEGWTVAGTVPSKLDGTLEEMRGRRVTLTATVEPSRDDRTHGWYSRPTKAVWIDVEAMAA